jgi:hypothetical protein
MSPQIVECCSQSAAAERSFLESRNPVPRMEGIVFIWWAWLAPGDLDLLACQSWSIAFGEGREGVRDRSGELDWELKFKLVGRAADAGYGESGQFRQSKYLPSTFSVRDGFYY